MERKKREKKPNVIEVNFGERIKHVLNEMNDPLSEEIASDMINECSSLYSELEGFVIKHESLFTGTPSKDTLGGKVGETLCEIAAKESTLKRNLLKLKRDRMIRDRSIMKSEEFLSYGRRISEGSISMISGSKL